MIRTIEIKPEIQQQLDSLAGRASYLFKTMINSGLPQSTADKLVSIWLEHTLRDERSEETEKTRTRTA